MGKIVYPDYNNCILNLITSILKYYNVQTEYKGLDSLDALKNNTYKNVVLVILDGMGNNLLNEISPNGFFAKNKLSTITSVCPSTTTAALNTYYSGKPPIETGWIAKSQYFKEYGRYLDMFLKTDSYTGELYKNAKFDVFEMLEYKSIFAQIEEASPNTKAYEINPTHCQSRAKRLIKSNDIQTMCENVISICNNKENNFILVYSDNPDILLHQYGCNSDEAKQYIVNSEKTIENMCKELENSNTLLIVSADHGHNDIDTIYNSIELDEINEYLIMPPSLESRFLAFWVKEDRKKEFETAFNNKFKNKFVLYTREELIEKKFLGEGKKHSKVDDFLGNYVAISIAGAIIKPETFIAKGKGDKKSTHCGLTENEMIVPLIVKEL